MLRKVAAGPTADCASARAGHG